jgi:hypothetical protein
MSYYLRQLEGAERHAECMRQEAAMAIQPRELRLYVVQIKRGQAVRVSFPVYGYSSMEVAEQHMDLLCEGEKLDVQAVGVAA